MKVIQTLTGLILAIELFIGCSSPYLRNRGRDLADIGTVEFEDHSYGASLRVGPFQGGGSYKAPVGSATGLRGGDLGVHHTAGFTFLLFGADYFSKSPMKDLLPPEPEKKMTPEEKLLEEARKEKELQAKSLMDRYVDPSERTVPALRGKEYRARAPFGSTIPIEENHGIFKGKGKLAPLTYFTDLQFQVGIFYGIRLGVNPGEILDLILGITGFDLYGDDEPFEDPLLKRLKESPEWNQLSPEEQLRLKEEIEKQSQMQQKTLEGKPLQP